MEGRLLHGTLYVAIFGIDKIAGGRHKFGRKFLDKVKRTLLGREIVGSNIHAIVNLDGTAVGQTSLIENKQSGSWSSEFRIYCAHHIRNVVFRIREDHPGGSKPIGEAYILVEDISERFIKRDVEILDRSLNPISGNAKIQVGLQFFNVTQDPHSHWCKGILGSDFEGVPCVFFNQREGCKVTLYQDAHVPSDYPYQIPLFGGKHYEPHRCWEDIFEAIYGAKHFIYITGWYVYTQLSLVRDPERQNQVLGELLKKKADEGVVVLMLVWNNRDSLEVMAQTNDGSKASYGQETAEYFRNTNVRCILCPRKNYKGGGVGQGPQISTIFTHHQKTVVVDCANPEGSPKRRIVSFLGGFDLCDGRYDTQDHPLFKTLNTIHKNDFHQPTFPEASVQKGGPREPWHDIHCKLEGPAAWDVLYNFEQRWQKQVGSKYLIPQSKLEEFMVKPSPVLTTEDPETWKVQIFRSIDSSSAVGFPEKPDFKLGLATGKDIVFDRSIQDAYINAIRRAKNFIYIESQYFLGSSFGWKAKDLKVEDISALNLIPKELSLKIVSKIKSRERFTVYIVIPMWPEGTPESKTVQAMLYWQRRTMEMMYTDIAQALHVTGLDTNPREYLTFFCLGNREKEQPNEYQPTEAPMPDSNYSRAQQARRFMIYVHSNMMIVDDEYIIIGSANINQRSMDGQRDTEIAMGAFQPNHLAANQPPRGQVYGFRMALWHEHLQLIETSFQHPESLKCVQLLNHFANENWEIYSSQGPGLDLPRHLLRYPIEITNDGEVTYMPEFNFFPDTHAPVLGNKAVDDPYPLLTT